MIKLESLSLQRGTKELLADASLVIQTGQKWGIIGSNGTGKSSLFKLLMGELGPDKGNLSIPKSWTLSHMAQEVGISHQKAVDYILDGDKDLRRIEQDIEKCQSLEGNSHGDRLSRLYEQLEIIDGYTANARGQQLLSGLGFKPGDDQRSVTDFSGGWRIRLNLAQALMSRSDLLLLDEPTNHLDLDASVWLESWLQKYSGTLIIISHDRDFLDNVVQNIASFENAQLVSYRGNYSSYEIQKAERLAQQNVAFEKQQVRVKEIENFVRRFRAKATKAKQAQSRLKELERMERIAPAHIDSPFDFRFPEPEKIPEILINLDESSLGYDNTVLLEKVQLQIRGGSRIGLLGHNGAGKSTLMKSLSFGGKSTSNKVISSKTIESTLIAGKKTDSPHLNVAYFAQHQLEALDLDATAAMHLQRLDSLATEQKIRSFLGGFGFHGDQAKEVIRPFSGGEKARLAIAILAWQKPNLLLLDEPTNHLDLEMCHALTLALQAYEGAMVVISHDRHLLKNTVDDFYLVHDGRVSLFDGALDDYHRWLQQERKDLSASTAGDTQLGSALDDRKIDKKELRQSAAAQREKMKPYTKAIKQLENKMTQLNKKLNDVDQLLADPDLYSNNGSELPALLKQQGQLKNEIEEIEMQWMDKSEELEALFPEES